MESISADLKPALPAPADQQWQLALIPPALPHELAQLILILAAHSLVISPTGQPLDQPDSYLLIHLALVSPDNYTALQQFIYINVPWCSLHDGARRGDVALMRWWLDRSGMQAKFVLALLEASVAGHVHVLELWKAEYAHIAVDLRQVRHILRAATSAGQVAVVEWWMAQSGFDLASIPKRSIAWRDCVHDALAANCLRLVDLWTRDLPVELVLNLKSIIRLPAYGYAEVSDDRRDDCSVLEWISDNVQDFAADLVSVTDWGTRRISLRSLAHGGYLALLQWFLDKCRSLSVPVEDVFTYEVLHAAFLGEQVGVLQWWVKNGLPEDDEGAIRNLDKIKSPAALSWVLKTAGWAIDYLEAAVDMADSVELLDCWLAHCGLEKLKYTELAMDRASAEGRVDLLDWWIKSGCELKYSSQSLDLAAEAGHLAVLKWWLASDLEVKIHTPLTLASRGNHLEVMDWLWAHELYNKGAEEQLAVFESITCRNLDALRWWESRAWPTDPGVIDRIGRKLWDDELEDGADEVDEYGLRWWLSHSEKLDEADKERLETQWKEWEVQQRGYFMVQ